MVKIKEQIEIQNGLKFLVDELNFCSPIGRKKLMHRRFMTDPFELQMELDIQDAICNFTAKNRNTAVMAQLIEQLCQVNDISQTFVNLIDGTVLDDIQFFEVKKFSLIVQKLSKLLQDNGFDWIPFHDLSLVIDTLDPDKNRLPQFHIYSSYKPELAEIRQKIDACKDEAILEKLKWEEAKLEDKIRETLTKRLSFKALQIQQNLDQIGYLDMLLAHAEQIQKWNLCKPIISENETRFEGLFNPLVKHSTGNFQAIDIELKHCPTIITGANMAGKTVLLKTVGLAQTLCQFGFFVPAKNAEITLVDDILFSIGDLQSESHGLSSFAVEILNINKIIKEVKEGQQVLALVDELARTTNPEEGKALVSSFVELMSEYHTDALVTTHYGGLACQCRRLRVKGLKIKDNEHIITAENINKFMDYGLMEVHNEEVPMEALAIAEIFNIDPELIERAKKLLSTL